MIVIYYLHFSLSLSHSAGTRADVLSKYWRGTSKRETFSRHHDENSILRVCVMKTICFLIVSSYLFGKAAFHQWKIVFLFALIICWRLDVRQKELPPLSVNDRKSKLIFLLFTRLIREQHDFSEALCIFCLIIASWCFPSSCNTCQKLLSSVSDRHLSCY